MSFLPLVTAFIRPRRRPRQRAETHSGVQTPPLPVGIHVAFNNGDKDRNKGSSMDTDNNMGMDNYMDKGMYNNMGGVAGDIP